MEALLGRSETGIQNLDRPQKPPVFHDESKAELTTSAMGTIPITIQLHLKIRSRKEYGEGRQTK